MFFNKKENKNGKWQLIIIIIIILVTCFLKAYSFFWPNTNVKISDKNYHVLVADTDSHRFIGWSSRDNMNNFDGMLFVFKDYSYHTMVMRDMNFPLDIVWAVAIDDEGKKCTLNSFGFRKLITGLYHSCLVKVVDMAPQLASEKNIPENELTPYFSREKSTVVLELPSGFTLENKLKIGDIIEITD